MCFSCADRFAHLILVGATASGKGTLSKLIINTFENFLHISPGDILRLHVKLKTPLGRRVKSFMESGKLVPDDLIINSIFNELKKAKYNNWILDGFPRNLNQARILHNIKDDDSSCSCGFRRNCITAVFNLIVPDEIIIKRVSNRWVHLPSGRIYNEGFQEPRVKWKDDVSGDDLVQRADDKPDVVAERLKIHRSTTEPVLDFYRSRCVDVLDLYSEQIETIWPTVYEYLRERGLEQSTAFNTT